MFKARLGKKLAIVFLLLLICGFTSLNSALYDPIAVYLTWQRSPDTTMTIRWITRPNRQNTEVEYRTSTDAYWKSAYGYHIPMPDGHPYLIHSVELINLEPNQDYFFRTGHDALVYKFRTMPSKLDGSIRFIVGGDMYHDGLDLLHETNLQAAKTDPLFALVGGDIAYAVKGGFNFLPDRFYHWFDNWRGQKIERWLEWLKAWKKDMITSDNRLIPFLPAIGNHDTNGRFGQTPKEAPFFYSLFAMPGLQGYNVLDFGDYMSLIILDSGHTHSIGGSQEKWLAKALSERINVPHKFAIYHVPAYPSVRDENNKYSTLVRTHWVPWFERFGLTAAFENHDHAYKRTHPILQGHPDPMGVIYFGDGAWGMKKTRQPGQKWYLAKTASERYFMLVTLENKDRYFTAISSAGEILDQSRR